MAARARALRDEAVLEPMRGAGRFGMRPRSEFDSAV